MLYDNHCTGCHESQVHIRETHKAQSLTEVQEQTARWASTLRLDWQNPEIMDVSRYLYRHFYLPSLQR